MKRQSGMSGLGYLLLLLASIVFTLEANKLKVKARKVETAAESVEQILDGLTLHYLTHCEEMSFPSPTLESMIDEEFITPSVKKIVQLVDGINLEVKGVGFLPAIAHVEARFNDEGIAERVLSGTTDSRILDPNGTDIEKRTVVWSRVITNNLETSPAADSLMAIYGDSECF